MTELATTHGSPFDSIKHTDEQGEYWLTREMWQPAGYAQWQNFEALVQRAIAVCEDKFPGQIVFMPDHENPAGPRGGRPSWGDYRCTRYGAYMILSRSDKPELADYFVMQTLYAENAQRVSQPLSHVVSPEQETGSLARFDYERSVGVVEWFANGRPKRIDPDYAPVTQVTVKVDETDVRRAVTEIGIAEWAAIEHMNRVKDGQDGVLIQRQKAAWIEQHPKPAPPPTPEIQKRLSELGPPATGFVDPTPDDGKVRG
jgi:hypothetical protein